MAADKTVPMIAPDGTSGEIPVGKMAAAQKAGFKRAVEFSSPDGSTGYVPEDRAAEAYRAGFRPKNITANPAGEGTYSMWDDSGHKQAIPYSQVNVARGMGYQFDTNPTKTGLTPAQQFTKDQASDPRRIGGTDLRMTAAGSRWSGQFAPQSRAESLQRLVQAETDAPLPVRIATGIGKAGGTIAKPLLDVAALKTGQTPEEINELLAPRSTAESVAKYGTMATSLIPGLIAAPATVAGGLAGGALGGLAGGAAGEAMGLTPQQTSVLSDVGGLGGGVAGGWGASELSPLVRSLAIGDPDVPLARGLGITSRTRTGLSALQSAGQAEPGEISLEEAQGARPYGQGAKNLEDLQSKLSSARTEINAPLNQALDLVGNKRVSGPDGPKTISALETERRQLSAQLDSLRRKDPVAAQRAIQKGQSEADLKTRYDDIVNVMTPHLDSTGIDSRAIRMQDAQVASTLSRVAGRTTLPEQTQPYGFGKMANLSLQKPLQAPGEILGGLRDIAAGKPLWSGRPTDVNIQQGFSSAGQKPSFSFPRPDFGKIPLGAEFGVPQSGASPIDLPSVAGAQLRPMVKPATGYAGGGEIPLESVAGAQLRPKRPYDPFAINRSGEDQ